MARLGERGDAERPPSLARVTASRSTPPTRGMALIMPVVQDAAGKLYDTFASNTPKGRKRLVGRVRAAQT